MKKLITSISSILLFSLVSHNLKAQEVGYSRIHVGVGLFNPGIDADYERIIFDNIGVGVYAALTKPGDLFGASTFTLFEVDLGVRGAYHFNELLNIPDKYDVYAAVGAGIEILRFGTSTGVSLSGLAKVGAAMKFSDKMSFFSEVGKGSSAVTAGIRLGM